MPCILYNFVLKTGFLCVTLDVLDFRDPPVPASQVLGLKAHWRQLLVVSQAEMMMWLQVTHRKDLNICRTVWKKNLEISKLPFNL